MPDIVKLAEEVKELREISILMAKSIAAVSERQGDPFNEALCRDSFAKVGSQLNDLVNQADDALQSVIAQFNQKFQQLDRRLSRLERMAGL